MEALNPGTVSIIIAAYNEEDRLGDTLDAIIHHKMADEVIVVDDGSRDGTARVAAQRGVRVIRLPKNRGKGYAMAEGLTAALGSVIVFLDADLCDSAAGAMPIIDAVTSGKTDLAIGCFSTRDSGGFGIVMKFARWAIKTLCGYEATAPLSGQRALKRETLKAIYPMRRDFGVETAMIIDAVRGGYSVMDVPVKMSHRPTGRTLMGFLHRAHQGFGIAMAVFSRVRAPRLSKHRIKKAG